MKKPLPKTIIALPNILLNPIYVSGLDQPLLSVADILDEQNKPEYARALREAATACDTFAKVNLLKIAELA